MGKSSFIWNSPAYQQGENEPEPHREARLRVGNLVIQCYGVQPDYKKQIELAADWIVFPDLFIELNGQKLDLEFDGLSHSTTAKKAAKDKSRDRALAEKGIITVRYLVEDVNGKTFPQTKRFYKLTDKELIGRIEAHLK